MLEVIKWLLVELLKEVIWYFVQRWLDKKFK